MAGYSEGREGKGEGKGEREKQKDGVVYDVVPLLLPTGPIGRADDRDLRHP
jgi:hypothetical protein